MNRHVLFLFLIAGSLASGFCRAAELKRSGRAQVTATQEEAKVLQQARKLRETDMEKAEALLTGALSEKRTPVLLFELASLRAALGRTEEAAGLFREAVALHDVFPDAHKNIGRLEATLGNYQEAVAALRRGIRQGGTDFDSCSLLGQLCVALGRFSRAEFPLRMALMGEPENWKLHFYLGRSLYGQGRYPECERAVQEALEFEPLEKRLWTLLANARIADGRPAEAVDAVEACVRLGIDGGAGILWTLGDLYLNEGLYDAAVAVYKRALKKGEPERESLKNVVLAFHAASEVTKARTFARMFLDRFGDEADVLLVLGEIAMEEKNLKEADGLFKKAARTDPMSGRALLLCAEVASRREDYERALAWYTSLEAVKGYEEQALRGKVSLLLENERLEEALEVLKKLNRRFPGKAWRELIDALNFRL